MPELVAHRPRGDRKHVPALGCATESGVAAADSNLASPGSRIIADEVGLQPERAEAGGPTYEKVPRYGQQINENDIDIAVVVTGVGLPVRPVVIEETHVHIAISLLQNLEIEGGEFSRCAGLVGNVGG